MMQHIERDTSEPTLFTASWVVPMDQPPLRNGYVAVQDGRILAVGGAESMPDAGELNELGRGVLLPGLVNAHCHLELSHLRGRVDPLRGYVPWIEAVVATRGADPEAAIQAATEAAIDALLAHGTAAVGDVSNGLGHLDLLQQVPLTSVVFHELLGWDPERAEEILRAADERVLARLAALRHANRVRGSAGPGQVEVRLAAHAPHSVSAPLLRALAGRGGPAAIHLAESQAETRFLASANGEWAAFLAARGLGQVPFRAPGTSPVHYADGLGVLHPRLVAAHCVQTDTADRALLAARGVHVVLCPRSNRALGVGLADVPGMLAAGVRLCLGTDSLASAPSLDVLAEAAMLHAAFPDVPKAALVRMATAGGAEALGLDELGTLRPGKRAALAFAPSPRSPDDPFGFLVSGEARALRVI